jgi:hypothetical protein
LSPVAFVAENSSFALKPNGRTDFLRFADWRTPFTVDLPQRFGDGVYYRIDPGQSELRFDLAHVAMGISTSNEYWGPANEHPIVLGDNAAGFPRVFVGTSSPLTLKRIGTFQGRLLYGHPGQSAYGVMRDSAGARLLSGVIASFQPTILPGVEIGGTRLFHVLQQRFTLDFAELQRPFGVLFKSDRSLVDTPENQIASIFARVVFPRSGLEVYGEFGREDHNWDLKEFWQFMDHSSAYVIGTQKAWKSRSGVSSILIEILNSRVSHLALSSPQIPIYVHNPVRQGHTNYGQALGSVAGHGGGAFVFRFERHTEKGNFTVAWERLQLGDDRNPGNAPALSKSDILHQLKFRRTTRKKKFSFEFGVAGGYEFNRHGPGKDGANLQSSIALFRR